MTLFEIICVIVQLIVCGYIIEEMWIQKWNIKKNKYNNNGI